MIIRFIIIIRLTTEPSNKTKNKTVSDSCTNNGSNGLLSKTTEPTKKLHDKNVTSKSTSGLLSASINNGRANSLTSNVNHFTKKAKEPSPTKSLTTTKIKYCIKCTFYFTSTNGQNY